MTPAGSTATPEPHHDATAEPAATRSGGGELFAAFRTEALKRREQHTRVDAGRPADWADPDPAALALLHPRRNPVARVIARQKEGDSRYNFVYKLRVTCARLQGVDRTTVTVEDLHAYPWHHVDADAAEDYRRDIYHQYPRQTTRNDHISVLRRIITECHKVGLISALRKDEVMEQLYTMAPGPSTRRRRLTPAEIERLLEACEDQTELQAAARDTAMVALFRTTGMRSVELARLDLADWDTDEITLLLRDTKNGRDHLVFLHPDAVPYLVRWVGLRGSAPGALFTPLPGSSCRHLDPQYVHQRIQLHARTAGIAPFGSHDFRRTFATDLLRHHEPALVGKLLNHAKLTSTLIYDLAGEDEQRAAVARIELPGAPEATADRDDLGGAA